MHDQQSPQAVIEAKMREIGELGHYDMVHLFSSEGLVLAEYYRDSIVSRDRLAEIALLFQDVKKMADVMGQISSIKEMIIEGNNKRKIVVRYFEALDDEVLLTVVVPPDKSYRSLTNALVKVIQGLNL